MSRRRIRRSVQNRVSSDLAGSFAAVGVTEIILIVRAYPVAQAKRAVALLLSLLPGLG